jgi:dTDP-4-dehydrorhamnose reductase
MRILVTGAMGRLGGRLVEILTPRHEAVQGVDIPDFNIADWEAASAYTAAFKPDIVLHPAAWTDVDGCAREPERAIAINGLGAQNMALAATQVGAAFLYVSSNEVFDGKHTRPYNEYDLTNPINPYGYSKWVGEQAISRANPRHYIVRTAWLFAHGGKNFIQAILNGAKAGKSLRVVVNEVANPTYNDDLADAIAKLIDTQRYGIYHFVNEGACSRYAFARYILDQTGYASTPITAISASEWPRPSTPPVYSSLSNLAGRSVGITLRPWQAAVDAFLEKEELKA